MTEGLVDWDLFFLVVDLFCWAVGGYIRGPGGRLF